ncbi:hypothetical protein CGLAU_09605 [Corynebacterium glaucum]|uniref:DUF1772 domain-containing protein n=1 Tax=Corynebacterium glaucum TaxID=187491 RepID=A0A1Q2HYF4_9CORY|nr:DUF1772 domain-containing protein [Corynebacterium glaucum]AQQ15872.1 hypothetical protein CGLAU_09605 [Corynebacterium glaucum]WJZ08356.1 hypothetical protein CGLAUT_09405 [Corynebacterium glaucum]
MDLLLLSLLLVTGFVGCAEFGSVALVHPVIRRLPVESQVVIEKGLLRTFGLVMPLGMTAAAVLAGFGASRYGTVWLGIAAGVLTIALLVTVFGNVPLNFWTGRIPNGEVPADFRTKRRRWDVYQAVRGSLQLLGFVLVCISTAAS